MSGQFCSMIDMRHTAIHLASGSRLGAVVGMWLAVFGAADAQQFQFGFSSPPPVTLSAPRIDVVSGTTTARLEQARALAADENWSEAVDIYAELAGKDSNRLVPLDERRFVSLREYCHLQLARLPAAGLAMYRRRVDPLAERWYREGISARDERLLRRIVDELYCSSWGDDALFALGELALEQADYATARRAWEQISPLLRDPMGRTAWLALSDVDLNAHWAEVELRWLNRSKSADWLAYPDSDIDLADVRARLVLTSIRAGQFDRAAFELNVFRRFHPMAAGRLGGQEGPYVVALERLLSTAHEWPPEPLDSNWPTFAGSQDRSRIAPPLGPILVPAWPAPVPLTAAPIVRAGIGIAGGGLIVGGMRFDDAHNAARESDRPLSCFPIVVGGVVVYADSMAIRAVALESGKPAITADGVLYRNDVPDGSSVDALARGIGPIANGSPRYTLTAVDGVVYGRVGRLATTQSESQQSAPGDRLVGLDLARDGLLTFRARPDDGAWSFDGAPLSDGRHVFVAMRRSDVTPHAYVACFDAVSGVKIWSTSIGAADTPASGRGEEITHSLLSRVGQRLYFNSNLGLVAALDVERGDICWLYRYDRISPEQSAVSITDPACFQRDPSPCLYHDGMLIVAPSDTQDIFALDADTGGRVWIRNDLPNALHLLGVVGPNVVVSGHRLWMLDVHSGEVQFAWPESERAGIRGMGRGLVAGTEVFWPTRHEVYVFDVMSGARSRGPISLASVGDSGANLSTSYGNLLAAGPDRLMAFGPAPAPADNAAKQDKSLAISE
jgi:hypothetical protein